MAGALKNTAINERQSSCVATQQKAVYKWCETRHSDEDVVDIYSPEWQERITSWHKWFIETHGRDHVHSETVQLRRLPEELDFRSFFFEHPVAAISLWHVLQAFYGLDKAICATSSDAESTLATWKNLKPFKYLKSEDVRQRWKNDLVKLDAEIATGKLTGEDLNSRMYDILHAVERIEAALDLLEEDFKFDYHDVKPVEWMLDTVTEVFDIRCLTIAKLLKKSADAPPAYEVLASDPRMEGFLDNSLGDNPAPPTDDDSYLSQFWILLELLHMYMYGIIYISLTIAIAFLCSYLISRPDGIRTLPGHYESRL